MALNFLDELDITSTGDTVLEGFDKAQDNFEWLDDIFHGYAKRGKFRWKDADEIYLGPGVYHHEGTECGILLEGELEVETDGKVYELKPGDSITLSSATPHRLTNNGKSDALAIWVNSKAWCFSTK